MLHPCQVTLDESGGARLQTLQVFKRFTSHKNAWKGGSSICLGLASPQNIPPRAGEYPRPSTEETRIELTEGCLSSYKSLPTSKQKDGWDVLGGLGRPPAPISAVSLGKLLNEAFTKV